MNLSEQVVSLEIAKRLKGLGVKQESLFYHHQLGTLGGQIAWVLSKYDEVNIKDDADWLKNKGVAAFTVAELGELLSHDSSTVSFKNPAEVWVCKWVGKPRGMVSDYHVEYHETEANARAKMLIYLLENGFIKP